MLDGWPLDVAVHLGAVTGGSSEADAIGVNVAGTRTLLRYLVDRGVKRIVLASSVAAVGCLSPGFRPRRLPVDDEHPCDAVDAYGLSKYLVEEMARYFCRLDPTLEITAFRIGSVLPPGSPEPGPDAIRNYRIPFTQLGTVTLDEVVRLLRRTVSTGPGPGFRIVNLVSPTIRSPWPTVATLEAVLGAEAARYDLSWYAADGRAHAGLWATDRLRALEASQRD